MSTLSRRVLLVGAGHGHLHAIRNAPRFDEAGHRLVVLSPRHLWYSGLVTGVLGGRHPAERCRIDARAIAREHGAGFVEAKAVAIDLERRVVTASDGAEHGFDLLSLDVGSAPAALASADDPAVYPVKPPRKLAELRAWLERRWTERPNASVRVVVAGGGFSGCECAANLIDLVNRFSGLTSGLTLVAGASRLAPAAPQDVSDLLARLFAAAGVDVRLGTRVVEARDGAATLSDGASLPYDALVDATGLEPDPLLAKLGLPVDERGALIVDRHLRSIANPEVFAVGDAAAYARRPGLAKAGVHAIREGPVLASNLLAALAGEPLKAFEPRDHYLWIMNLGDGTGLAARGRFWWRGRTALWLKDWIDLRFLREHTTAEDAG